MRNPTIYEVPIPRSFFESGGQRGISIALAFDPPTRLRRLDYLASKMDFHLVRGMSADEVEQVFVSTPEEEIEAIEEAGDDGMDAEAAPAERPGDLGSRLIRLDPPATVRARGTNQLGRRMFLRRLSEAVGDSLLLVVRNTNQWAPDGDTQDYGLAVALWRDEDHSPIYAELEARIALPVELQLDA